MATRKELIEAVGQRYRDAARKERIGILDEFVRLTGYHRKHAIRVLRRAVSPAGARVRERVYDEAVKQALIILWEAAIAWSLPTLRQADGVRRLARSRANLGRCRPALSAAARWRSNVSLTLNLSPQFASRSILHGTRTPADAHRVLIGAYTYGTGSERRCRATLSFRALPVLSETRSMKAQRAQ